MKITKSKLILMIKEEISHISISEDAEYDSQAADLDLVMKNISIEKISEVIDGYLEDGEQTVFKIAKESLQEEEIKSFLYNIITDMPSVELSEIYNQLKSLDIPKVGH